MAFYALKIWKTGTDTRHTTNKMSLQPSVQACSGCGKHYPVSFLIGHVGSCLATVRETPAAGGVGSPVVAPSTETQDLMDFFSPPSQQKNELAVTVPATLPKRSWGVRGQTPSQQMSRTTTDPWSSLPDKELFHKLVESDVKMESERCSPLSFSRHLVGARRRPDSNTYEPGDDTFSTIVFPFAIQMDRLRMAGKVDEVKAVKTAMFAELKRQLGEPRPVHPSQVHGGAWGAPSDAMSLNLGDVSAWRQHAYEKERERKAAEAAAAAKEQEEADRLRAIEELGEICKIGQAFYFVKEGVVFNINGYSLESLTNGFRVCGTSMFNGLPLSELRTLRGPRAFGSTNEAEAHWVAVEEDKIVEEARRRLAEEEKRATEEAREVRIRHAMENLRGISP